MPLNSSRFTTRKNKISFKNSMSAADLRKMRLETKEKRIISRNRLIERRKMETILVCFSYIAAIDKISFAEAREHVSRYFSENQLRIPLEHNFLISNVTKETVSSRILASYAACFSKVSTRQKLLESLLSLAMHRGELSSETEFNLDEIAELFRFPPQKYASLKRKIILRNKLKKQINEKKSIVDSEPFGDLLKCYKALGSSPNDSDAILKQKYRALVKEFHPDRHAAKNLTEVQLAQKVKKFQKIQAAYECIKETRQRY